MNVDGSAVNLLAVAIWVENVANGGTIGEWSVWNRLVNSVVAVGKGDEHFTSIESVEVVSNVFLFKWVAPGFSGLSSSIDSGSLFVADGAGVHILPKRLSILWVITTSVVLFGTIVVEWDTSGSLSEEESVSEHLLVTVAIQESGVVVVVDEDTESINVIEVGSFFFVSILDSIHGLT